MTAQEEKRADEIRIQMAKIEADKELIIKEMELKAQIQASSSTAVDPPSRNRNVKSPKLSAFIDKKGALDNYLLHYERYAENAKWERLLELSGSSSGNFDDLTVKEQFINLCSEELAVYLLGRGPKDLVELTKWAQQYLIAHQQQLGARPSLQSSLNVQRNQHSLN